MIFLAKGDFDFRLELKFLSKGRPKERRKKKFFPKAVAWAKFHFFAKI